MSQATSAAEFRDAAKAVSVALGIVRRTKNLTEADMRVVDELEKSYLSLIRHAMLLETAGNPPLQQKLRDESISAEPFARTSAA